MAERSENRIPGIHEDIGRRMKGIQLKRLADKTCMELSVLYLVHSTVELLRNLCGSIPLKA